MKNDTMVQYVTDRHPEFAPRPPHIMTLSSIPAAVRGRREGAARANVLHFPSTQRVELSTDDGPDAA